MSLPLAFAVIAPLLCARGGEGGKGFADIELAPGAWAAQQRAKCNPATDPDCGPSPDDEIKCQGVAARPPAGSRRYRCEVAVRDAYGRPVANRPVSLEARWCNKFGTIVRASATALTDAQGRRTLSVLSPPANQLECDIGQRPEPAIGRASQVQKSSAGLPSGTTLSLTTTVQPSPTASRSLAGLDAGEGRMDLFQSGRYDRALVIAEHFDQFEHGSRRNRQLFWRQLSQLLTALFEREWDVWLAQPHDTGESFHEQSAEFAQAVAHAAAAYSAGPVAPPCNSPTVGVLGFNTGGLVGRIATARWEADPAWRAALGLPAALPLKFLATFDSPHYGMHLNLDMQKSMWKNKSGAEIKRETNLDSCAASQMLRGRFDPAFREVVTVNGASAEIKGRKTNEDFLNFFVRGAPVRFFSKAENVERTCAAGPPVATLNAARGVPGWPSTPVRIGFTQSNSFDRIKCSADPDKNTNSRGFNLCKHVTELCAQSVGGTCVRHVSAEESFTPSAGQTWVRLFADDPTLPDLCPDEFWKAEDKVEWSDIAPGSINSIFFDGFVTSVSAGPLFCNVFAHQRFPTTLVPFVSAAGIQGPRGASNYAERPSPFDELHESALPRVNGVVDANDAVNLFGRLNAFPPGCADSPVLQP